MVAETELPPFPVFNRQPASPATFLPQAVVNKLNGLKISLPEEVQLVAARLRVMEPFLVCAKF
jgi:hypothetical protein